MAGHQGPTSWPTRRLHDPGPGVQPLAPAWPERQVAQANRRRRSAREDMPPCPPDLQFAGAFAATPWALKDEDMDGGNWKEMFNAACEGDLELVRYHVKIGVDIDYAHPEFLSTPLVACALAGQEKVALFLLESGANPNLRSEFDAMTPVQAARTANLPLLEERLLQLGAVLPAEVGQRPLRSWLRRLFASSAA